MRSVTLMVALSLYAVSLFASPDPSQLQPGFGDGSMFMRVESSPGRLQEVLAKLSEPRMGASAVAENRPARAVLIPAAANAQGANGTWFRSDLTLVLHSMSQSRQNVQVIWIPEGNPDGAVEFTASMRGQTVLDYPDFVGTELGLMGTGALLFVPVDELGEPDPAGIIDATSRIWTPAPGGGAGTLSLQFPGLDVSGLFSGDEAWIYGLRVSEQFRANYGIINLSDVPLTFEVTLDPHAPQVSAFLERVTVRPGELIRRSVPAWGVNSYVVLGIRSIGNDEKSWTAYASSTDNASGDGWVSIASRLPGSTD